MNTLLVPLTRNQITVIDEEDAPLVLPHSWRVQAVKPGVFYAARSVRIEGQPRTLYLHRMLMGAQPGQKVDHINGDRLDNRRSLNLRLCTESQNRANAGLRSNNTSGFKGVSWSKDSKKWTTFVRIHGRGRHYGYFDDPRDAAIAYDVAATELFGDFARLNFPKESA